MSAEEHRRRRVFSTLVVTRAASPELVVVIDEGEHCTLPRVETRDHWNADVAPVVDAATAKYGLRTTVLRCLRWVDAEEQADAIYEMECRDADPPLPASARLTSVGEALPRLGPQDAAILRGFTQDTTRDRRAPWTRHGWRDDTLAWAEKQLLSAGMTPAVEAQQVKQWSIASIWRIPTSAGDAWLKAVPPMFAHEGSLMALLAPSMPRHLPRVIATDRDRGCTLMHPLPMRLLGERADPSLDERAVCLLARLQQHWRDRVDDLLAAGCPDRRLDMMPAALNDLLEHDDVRRGFTPSQLSALADFARTVPERIEGLRACGVPETLVHGDFHALNLAVSDVNDLVLFDWTDGCVAHPFFDLATFLPTDAVERAALLHAYLGAWEALAPAPKLEHAWELAEPLAMVHHAVSYMRILDAVRERWQFDSDPVFWLRWLREILPADA